MTATEQVEDGRRARRERNREAVVDALLELYRTGNLAPSSDEIAAQAGLSPRSLFRYFDDVDDLARAAISRQQRHVWPMADLRVASEAPFAERLALLVEQRVRLFEAIGAVGRVARLRAPFQPLVADEMTQGRAFLRGQLTQLFGPELAAMTESRAAARLAIIDVVCSFEAYQLLRFDQGLTRAKAAAALTDSLQTLFEQE